MALLVVVFTQCKKTPIDEGNDNKIVQVRCVIPINDGGKSDFTTFMQDGRINWKGNESIYLAIPGTDAQLVELTATANDSVNILEFEATIDAGLLNDDTTYDVWYLGNAKYSEKEYLEENKTNNVITSIVGSIATQSGNLTHLGYHHIAKTTVTANEEEGNFTLTINGKMENQIAIAYLDLTDVDYLGGKAILGTEYELKYENGNFNFVVKESSNATIQIDGNGGKESFIVMFPNPEENTWLKSYKKNNEVYGFKFFTEIKPNRTYYKTHTDGETVLTLPLDHYIGRFIGGHEYVDFGLKSGTLWSTCNLGADVPEEAGDYFAWGETAPKDYYSSDYEAPTGLDPNNPNSMSGNKNYDAATAIWGNGWRIPTGGEVLELLVQFDSWIKSGEATLEWVNSYGVDGGKLTAPNGNSIFFPVTGGKYEDKIIMPEYGGYWTAYKYGNNPPSLIVFGKEGGVVTNKDAYYGICIRPVYGPIPPIEN